MRPSPRDTARPRRALGLCLAAALLLPLSPGCRRDHEPPEPPPSQRLRLWHTFNPAETQALNQALSEWAGAPVEASMAPFGLGLAILGRTLREGKDCPDLVRLEATWLPRLAANELLAAVPEDIAGQRDFLPEAQELATIAGTAYGLPQASDGLAIVYRKDAVPADWPPADMASLLDSALALTGEGRYGLGLRVDGYWFVPFLRAFGPGLLPGMDSAAAGAPVRTAIDDPGAVSALERFAALFGAAGVSPPPAAPDEVDSEEIRRFRDGSLVAVVNGPWAIAGLTGGDTEGIGVAPLPHAPRGGHSWAVPRCARQPAAAWRLALHLTEPTRQAAWAKQLGVIPTTAAGLAQADAFVRSFHDALSGARPLPRHPITPALFDDLTPALAAAVSGNAAPAEALAGVARAWARLLEQQGYRAAAPAPAPAAVPAPAGQGDAGP
ncbi:sugar ABC transporter substrate-binding protein [Haliangium ochraceum]|uniref:Extracellular solute-binding protein family 1 n=1 Tax=Haliangium ochraceum (strain DSM 14365 / JCM 11303 / SMP-2) TaxID=502025 RepID=D0LIH1_HALO1|nr:extracellular solute-binding protein [Haliangium ochraceum]ACY18327.1 extracellular solute-binding protein family 1 [Haliangium ochraceum DSM 14365]